MPVNDTVFAFNFLNPLRAIREAKFGPYNSIVIVDQVDVAGSEVPGLRDMPIEVADLPLGVCRSSCEICNFTSGAIVRRNSAQSDLQTAFRWRPT